MAKLTMLCAAVALSGCATYQSKVQATLDSSKTVIDAAKAAGADQYAPETLKSAENYLAQAQQLMNIGKLEGAASSAQQAAANAQLAQEQAQTGKQQAQIDALRQEIAALAE